MKNWIEIHPPTKQITKCNKVTQFQNQHITKIAMWYIECTLMFTVQSSLSKVHIKVSECNMHFK